MKTWKIFSATTCASWQKTQSTAATSLAAMRKKKSSYIACERSCKTLAILLIPEITGRTAPQGIEFIGLDMVVA